MPKFLCVWMAVSLAAVPAAAADLVVEARSGYAIDATINGQPVRLRVDPETSGYIVLNPAAAARLGLHRSMLGSRTRIGPVRLDGSSKVANVSIGGVAGNRRLVWIDRPVIEGADGVIGPADMPYDTVTFAIGTPRDGETAFEMPMEFARSFGLYVPMRLGEHEFRFQFSLMKPFSLATAGAGAELASLYGGSWAGDALDQVIEFGVIRPVRPMTFARPISLQGLELRSLRVRTGDNRGNLSLPPEPDADPDELVVTGASRQRAAFVVHVGADRLSQCSAIVWDNRSRHMILRCPAS
jgi:hypothetical protein